MAQRLWIVGVLWVLVLLMAGACFRRSHPQNSEAVFQDWSLAAGSSNETAVASTSWPGATPQQAEHLREAERAQLAITWDAAQGVPSVVRGEALGTFGLGPSKPAEGQGDYERDALAKLDCVAELFRIREVNSEFRVRRVEADRLGYHHVRLQQMYRGLRVVGGELMVHFDQKGRAYEVNGAYRPDLAVQIEPVLRAAEAVAAARADLEREGRPAGELISEPELVVLTRRPPARLAYELTLAYGRGTADPGRWRYWINAENGTTLEKYNDIQYIPAPSANGYHAAVAGSILAGEGGGVTNVIGWYDNLHTNYYLYNTNLHWIVENVASSGYPDAHTYSFRPTSNWGASDRTEISLGLAFELTQRYYHQVHGLNSFNDLGILARANVHLGDSYVNAYWDGNEFYFGDGDGITAHSLAVLDIAGHEFTHAITEYSANLVYMNEPGALNESFSDIMGSCIEFFGQADDRASYPSRHAGQADWLCGEDSWLETTALRDLRNPANAATVGAGNEQPTRHLGTYWYSDLGDNGGVHQNSGVQNFFFYLLSEGGSGTNDGIVYSVAGIGRTNAEQVAFRALTVYCTANTDYRGVRDAWISAAQDLEASWAPSVRAAWDAVGVQAVSVFPAQGGSFWRSQGGPFSPTDVVFTLTNHDVAAVGWSLTHTQAWVTVTPAGGVLASFGAQAVTVTVNAAAESLGCATYQDTLRFENTASSVSESRTITLTVYPETFYTCDLSTNPNWQAQGQWAFGVPQGLAGDPASGFTGPHVYGYNLAGAYSNNIPEHFLTSPALDCSGHENIFVQYRRWLGVEHSYSDHARLYISTDGSSWTLVWDHTGDTLKDTSWQTITHDISSIADGARTVYLRWGMGPTDYSVTYSGWNLDDICLLGHALNAFRVLPGDGFATGGYEGGPFSPTSKLYQVVNKGSNAVSWTASVTSSWAQVSSAGASLNPGDTGSLWVALTPAAALLPPGTHRTALVLSNQTSGFRTTREISLQINSQPGELDVWDSLAPTDDLQVPFGGIIVGLAQTASITLTNSDPVKPLVLTKVGFNGYLEDFQDGLAQDWRPSVSSHWLVVSGEYRARASSMGQLMQSLYVGHSWSNFSVEAVIRCIGGVDSTAGLVFRATDTFNWDTETGSAYLIGISGDGYYCVGKYVNGAFAYLQDWTASPLLHQGPTANEVRVTMVGSAIQMYFNGNLAFTGTDTSLGIGGWVGLIGHSGMSSECVYYFDQISINELFTGGAICEAQPWSNEHPAEDGNCAEPRDRSAISPYPGPFERLPSTASLQKDGPFQLVNEPASFPYVIAAHSSVTFQVTYAPSALASNSAEIVIESNDADEPTILMALSGQGIEDYLSITPDEGLVARGHPGGPFQPSSMVYALTNRAAMTIQWTVGSTKPWVVARPLGGTLAAGETAMVTVSVNAATAPQAEGTYGDTVVFSNATTGLHQMRPLALTVFTSPIVQVAPGALSVTNQRGQSLECLLNIGNHAAADGLLTFRLISSDLSATPLPSAAPSFVSRIEPGQDFTQPAKGEAFAGDNLLVRFEERLLGVARETLLRSLGGGKIRREYRLVPGLTLVDLPTGLKTEEALRSFNGQPGIVYASPNYVVQAFDTIPNDARFEDLWGMRNIGQAGGAPGADIDAPKAWDAQTGRSEIIVAVVDTGIDYNHEDLAENMWVNPDEIPGNLRDDDGNGYIDDVHGINAITGSGDPMDDNNHGTHCAGTIGGRGNNGVGVAGVCWRVRLMGAKFLSASGSGTTADAITAIEYATLMGARVMNNSWGGGANDQALKDAIDAAGAAQVVFVAAAGNNGSDNDVSPQYPSSYNSSNIISVMATDRNDLRSSFSCYGRTSVDLAAPGSEILSCKRGGGYVSFDGTSMATPHVAGAAALLLSVNPQLTAAEVKQALLDSVDPLFPSLCVSGGRLNLFQALARVNLPWLTLNPGAATNLPPGSSTNILVGLHATELLPAIYEGEIILSCNDLTNPVVHVPVTMTIVPEDLRLTPSGAYAAAGAIGGPFTPTQQVYVISNSGPSVVNWSVSHTSDCWSVSTAGGLLSPGGVDEVVVRVHSPAHDLPVGDYVDTLLFSNRQSGSVLKRSASLHITRPPPENIFDFPLDVNPGWSTQGQWAFGVPQGVAGDPHAGFTGTNVYGYNLSGSYSNSMPVYALTTPALNCSGYTEVTLAFRRWLGIESAGFDHASVQVSSNGVNWVTVWNHIGSSFQDTSWKDIALDISAVADNANVYIRWIMGTTDGSITYGGWNLDDIHLRGQPMDAMRLNPSSSFNSAGCEGGPFDPQGMSYTVVNSSTSIVTWTATCASNWISLTPPQGALEGRTSTVVDVTLNAQAEALGTGVYQTVVLFSNTLSGVVQPRNVTLTVNGNLRFETSSYSVLENSGAALIRVWRFDYTNQSVSVDFATADGTATAGLDYLATNGTLCFAIGETQKTFAVHILEDTEAELPEIIGLTLSQPTGGGTRGTISSATLSIIDNEGQSCALPRNFYDGSNYVWDVRYSGYIGDGSADAFDEAFVLLNFPSMSTGLLLPAQQLVLGPSISGSVRITRRIYVPSNRAFCRFLEVLQNIGSSAVVQRVRLDTNLGSDSGTVVDRTSSGDALFGTNDDWIVTDDVDGSGDPTVAHVIANAYGRQRVATNQISLDFVRYEYDVNLAPGETKIVMHFGVQCLNRAQARAQAAGLAALETGTLDYLSAAEMGQVVNFGLLPAYDGDQDGAPDWWELQYGLDLSASNAPTSNIDQDDMTDLEEYWADTNPTSGLSSFPESLWNEPESEAILTLVISQTSTARVYGVHGSTNLLQQAPPWPLCAPELTGTGAAISFTLTNEAPFNVYRTGVRLP